MDQPAATVTEMVAARFTVGGLRGPDSQLIDLRLVMIIESRAITGRVALESAVLFPVFRNTLSNG